MARTTLVVRARQCAGRSTRGLSKRLGRARKAQLRRWFNGRLKDVHHIDRCLLQSDMVHHCRSPSLQGHIRMASCVAGELIRCAFTWQDPRITLLLQKSVETIVGHTAILTSILPKFLPCNMPIKEAGAFSSPSTISSRYLRRPVRTHSLTSRKKSGCFGAKSETMNPRRRRRLRNTENMSGPGIGLVALYCAIRPQTGMRAKSLSNGHTVCCTAPPTFSK